MRWIAAILVMGIAVMSAVAQTPAGQKPAFEVASIKQSVFPGGPAYFAGFSDGAGCTPAVMTISGTLVTLKWAGLCNIIARAYGVRDYAISGSAKWITTPDPSAYYDIQAKAPDDATPVTMERATAMLRTLLEERFQLKAHRQLKQMPVYALTIGKNGPKLRLSANGLCALHPNQSGIRMISCKPDTTMVQLADKLARYTDRPIIDKTGIEGGQVFELSWNGLLKRPVPPDVLASLFTAVQEDLGLRLEPTTMPVELVVIDSIERPSAN